MGIHSKIVRLTVHEWWSIYGWFMTTFTPFYAGEWPFKHITLYQLCYWKVTRIYGLTKEEIEDLITNPDPHIPSPHQFYPGIIIAYFTCECIYGLTQEEIENLLTNPDPHIPSHHQVDPRIIKAYFSQDIGCHIILESFQGIFLGTDSFLVRK